MADAELSDSEKLLFEYIQKLNVSEVVRLLNEDGVHVNCLDKNGMTPLQHAAYRGNRELCELFLDRGADVNSNHHEHGYTALMFAALSGNKDVILQLLEAGASTTAVNSVKRNAAQMAAFVGNHACVTLINSFVPKEYVEYYTKIQGLETEPRLPIHLASPLHRLLLRPNVHPVSVATFLQQNLALFENAPKVAHVLELMCEKEMKRTEVNEVLALKFHFYAFVVKQCDTLVEAFRTKKAASADKARGEILDDVIRHWLRGREKDGFQETLEKLVRQSIREFPYAQCPLIQQLVRSLAPVKIGEEPTAIGLLTSSLCGQHFGGGDEDAGPCATCSEQGARKRCSVCKTALYCDQRCQRLHWPVHKKECQQMASEYKRAQGQGETGTGEGQDGKEREVAPTNEEEAGTKQSEE